MIESLVEEIAQRGTPDEERDVPVSDAGRSSEHSFLAALPIVQRIVGRRRSRLDRDPAVVSLLLVLFENEIARLARVEIAHRRVGFLHPLEESQNRFARGRQGHLGVEVEIDVEIIRQRRIIGHCL